MTSRFFIFVAALLAAAPRPATAQAPGQDLEPAPISVVMVASRADEASSLVIRALEAQLSDLPVVFHVTWVGAHAQELPDQRDVAAREAARLGAVAVFWGPRLPAGRLYLLLAGGSGDRVLARPLEGESATTEAVALIVRGAVSALLESPDLASAFAASPVWSEAGATPAGPALRREEAPQPAAPAPAEPPRPDRAPPARTRLTLAAGYHLSLWSRDDPVVHACSIAVEARLAFGLMLGLGFVLGEPVDGQALGVELELLRFPIELGIGYRHLFGRAALSGVLAVDVTPFVKRVNAGSSMEVVNDGADLEVSLRPSVAVDVRLVASLHARFALGIEIPLTPVSYLVEVGSQTADVLVTWPVRPFFMVGLSLGVL